MLLSLLTVAAVAMKLAGADVQITVNASQPDKSVQQVNYLRGEVVEFDAINATPSSILNLIQHDVNTTGINLVTAAIDINSKSPDQSYFDYSPGPPMSLTPDSKGSAALIQAFGELRNTSTTSQIPLFIQISGVPYAFPNASLDPNYEYCCNCTGGYYPLPIVGNDTTLAQNAISNWIIGTLGNITNAAWLGSQEPTHTLGFSTAYNTFYNGANCSNPTRSEMPAALNTNIDRFVTWWTPIAQTLSSKGFKTGGIQPNAGDNPYYQNITQQIISAKMPLDYYTIQNYNPSLTVAQTAYAQYQQLKSTSPYQNVKVMFDRYGTSLTQYLYTNALGMMQYLIFESYLMQYADMLYGYSVETMGLHTPNTLLPGVFQWLQKAPHPLRPLSSSNGNVSGFALVQTSGSPSGSIAIWNNGTSTAVQNVTLALTGYPQSLSSASVTIVQYSGTTNTTYNSPSLSITSNSISGLSLGQNEVFLISF